MRWHATCSGVLVMRDPTDLHRALYKATEQFLVGDAPGLADELTDALLVVSARVSRLRKTVSSRNPVATEVSAVDEAFAQTVTLARRLSAALRAHQEPGGYVAVESTVRDLG